MLYKGMLFVMLGATPVILQAHHSVALNFSQDLKTLEGTVTSLKWINPHASFVLEVVNEDGTIDAWLVEMLALIALQRQGFDLDALQEGMQIQLTGRLGYKEYTMRYGEVVLPDGSTLLEKSPLNQRFTQ